MSNVFALQRPDMIECMVYDYHWGRGALTLRLQRENSPDIQYIKFSGVEYFSGPVKWKGANFSIRPTSECLELLQRAERVNELVTEDNLIERNIQLYTVELEHLPVLIVCHLANRYG